MAAQLIVEFTDSSAPGDPSQDAVRTAASQAFNEWTRHFDYTAGVFTINVSFRAGIQPTDVSLDAQGFTQVGVNSSLSVVEPSLGLSFAARVASSTTFPTPTLYVNPANFNGAAVNFNIVAPIERELGHALGISRVYTGSALTSSLTQSSLHTRETVYDTSIRFVQGNTESRYDLHRPERRSGVWRAGAGGQWEHQHHHGRWRAGGKHDHPGRQHGAAA